MANHLVNENSRYLQQHAGNPVDWYPWGEAAFAKARAEDKLIFLSIGYSACHWCHVMAHESFEDTGTAAFLNEHFVSIKVDREERPDLDRIYMSAVQAISGNGGWPMSVFITPEGEPVYGGTYFPKEARYGMPSFMLVLSAIAEAWQDKRGELLEGGQQVVAAIKQNQASGSLNGAQELTTDTIEQAYANVKQRFDSTHGGWGTAPKFPQPMILEFLLRYHHTVGDERSLEMVLQTLESMARGGIYDQLGGGFHRYSVDKHWLVPHFEKMLYDNALLARVYLHAYQITGEAFFRAIVEETLDYVAREMTGPEGGFYATQDADTEGEEGRFFLWTPDEVRVALNGPATRFLDLYGVTDGGNFEGRTILTFSGSFEERDALRGARRLLFQAREQRVSPGRDEKVLTSWNGLMLAAFAEASRVLQRPDYRQMAEKAADFLLRELRDGDGRLWHVWNKGQVRVSGLLEDYAGLITGLLALYRATFAPRWYSAAQELANTMMAHFSAPNGFYDTANDAESLVIRPQEIYDNAVPSGNSLAVTSLLELARLSGETHYEDIARQTLSGMQDQMRQQPLGFGQWLVALDSALSIPTEIAIVGEPLAEDTCALLDVIQSGYHPHQLLAVGTGAIPPLLEHREQIARKATAYVCVNHVCRVPVNTLQELQAVLDD